MHEFLNLASAPHLINGEETLNQTLPRVLDEGKKKEGKEKEGKAKGRDRRAFKTLGFDRHSKVRRPRCSLNLKLDNRMIEIDLVMV